MEISPTNPFFKALRKRREQGYSDSGDAIESFSENQPGILGRARDATLSGLGIVGNALDLPGSSVRDLLAGENPLDQWTTPFSDQNRVSGRDLLRRNGMVGSEDTWGNWAGGLAAEIALDPTTYVGGIGAWSKAGRAAKATGLGGKNILSAAAKKIAARDALTELPKVGRWEASMVANLSDVAQEAGGDAAEKLAHYAKKNPGVNMDEALGGLTGYGIPFTGVEGAIGTGKTAQRIGRGIDKLEAVVGTSAPGRFGKMLFHVASGWHFGKAEQELAEGAYDGIQNAKFKANGEAIDATETLGNGFKDWAAEMHPGGFKAPDEAADAFKQYQRVVRSVGEGMTPEAAVSLVTGRKVGVLDTIVDPAQVTRAQVWNMVKELSDTVGNGVGVSVDDLLKAMPSANPSDVTDAIKQLKKNRNLHLTDTDYGPYLTTIGNPIELPRPRVDAMGMPLPPEGELLSDTIRDSLTKTAGAVKSQAVDSGYEFAKRMGIKIGTINGSMSPDDLLDEINPDLIHSQQYLPRSGIVPEKAADKAGHGYREYPSGSANTKSRNLLREVPAEVANAMGHDLELRTGGREAAIDALKQKYGAWLKPGEMDTDQFAGDVVDYLRSRKAGDIYNHDLIGDLEKYSKGVHRIGATADAIHDYLGNNIRPMTGEGTTQTLRQAFDNIGMDPSAAAAELGRRIGKSPEDVLNLHVANEAVGAATAILAKVQNPEWFSVAGKAWDATNKVMKTWLTSPWPSFWARNFAGGQAMNAMSGHIRTASDIKDYAASVGEVMGIAFGKKAPPQLIGKDGNPINFLNSLHQYNVIPTNGMDDSVLAVANNQPAAARIMPANPLSGRESLKRAVKEVDDTGTGLLRKTRIGLQSVAETGQAFNAQVEWANRAGMYLYLLKKGFDPAEAAKEVKRLHVDYGQVTDFERNVAKRLVPFYGFSRGIAPVVAHTLATSPGGLMAQTVKHSASNDRSDITPDYIAETAAIPLGQQPDGSDRYLTGLGLPHEDTLSFLSSPGNLLRSGGLEALSRMNPLVKGPLEFATGQSFFQKGPSGGRSLDDLDPTVGRLLANVSGQKDAVPTSQLLETVLSNSPLSRALTTARTLTDERKGLGAKALNTLTGVRVTDVSPAAQESVLREAVQQMLKEVPESRSYSRSYVPKDAKAAMDPEKQAIVSRYESILKTLGERAKKRAEERKRQELAGKR
jgi:hypothetical protein